MKDLKPDTYGLFAGVEDDARKVAFNLLRRGWHPEDVKRAANLPRKAALKIMRQFFNQKDRNQ